MAIEGAAGPAAGPTSGSSYVYISGTDLANATALQFGGVAGTITFASDTLLVATSPAHAAGTVDVRVTTPDGATPIAQPADQFTYAAAPTAASDNYTVWQQPVGQPAPLMVSAPGVLANDSDPQALPLTAELLTYPADGQLALNANGSFTYWPNAGFIGTDSFTYQASDGLVTSAPATVTITVNPPALTWNSGQAGNWTGTNWGTGGTYPDAAISAVVGGSGSVVNVTADQAANALTLQSAAQAAIAAGASLTATTNASVTGGAALSVDPSGLLAVGGTFTLDTGGSVTGGPVFAAGYQLNGGTAGSNLGGSGGVTENGRGTVTVTGANTYSGGTTITSGTFVAENSAAIPSGSLLSIGPDGSVVLGNPGSPEPLAVGQVPGAGPLQVTVAAAGQAGMGPASLVVSGASVTPAGGGSGSLAVSGLSLTAAAAAVPTAAVAPAAVDRLLAAQAVPESNAVASAIVGRASPGSPLALPSAAPVSRSSSFILSPSSLLSPASPVPYSDAALVDHAGGQPAGDATARVTALRAAASGEASDEVLLRFADARPGDTTARAGNRQPAPRLCGLDLPTLDLLAAVATKRQ